MIEKKNPFKWLPGEAMNFAYRTDSESQKSKFKLQCVMEEKEDHREVESLLVIMAASVVLVVCVAVVLLYWYLVEG